MADYAGDLSPQESWALIRSSDRAALVDVRSAAEWAFVGAPSLADLGREVIFLEWQSWPGMAQRPQFADELEQRLTAQGVGRDDPVAFICRSGARSQSAARALAARGWSRCYNVATGFEGPLDTDRHRGTAGGWKADGLPWAQS